MIKWNEYRKIATIKAIQVTEENLDELIETMPDLHRRIDNNLPYVDTPEGRINFIITFWIAEGVEGEHWPIRDDIFRRSYKEA